MILTLLWACSGGGSLEVPPGRTEPVEPAPTTPAPAPQGQAYHRTDQGASPLTCDAGDVAWVQRVMPLLWGRRPHGAAEVDLWVQVAAQQGREAVVRAMARDPEYRDAWLDWFADALYVARTGDKEYARCFETPSLATHDGSLTRHLRDTEPDAGAFGESFVMADVIVDALVADDVSTIYRAHLFARMNKPVQGANVSAEELEYNRRVNFGELFYRTYLGRNLVCMGCHNSEFSVTDHPDPRFDLTWQLPGHFESALLQYPTGRDTNEAYAMFRHDGVVRTRGSGVSPWGMSTACGKFEARAALPTSDMLGQESAFFIRSYGPEGSVYDLERDLRLGVEALDGAGLQIGADGAVDGPDAFAYLLAANLASSVWETATGAELVVAHHFPRNEAQRARLKALADTVASSGFSLVDLLVAVTTDELFNQGLPMTCDAVDYGLEPALDPWTVEEEDPHLRRNGAGELVHRLPARAMLRSAHHSLGWLPRESWFPLFGGGAEEELQSAIGVFLRESDPGHDGTDFQGLLSWEREYGACELPAPNGVDVVDHLLAQAIDRGATVGEVAHALKDRLVSRDLERDEEPLVASLLGSALTDPARDDPELERGLRLYCGALLLSPQFHLITDAPLGAVPSLAIGVDSDCERIAALTGLSCDAGALRP